MLPSARRTTMRMSRPQNQVKAGNRKVTLRTAKAAPSIFSKIELRLWYNNIQHSYNLGLERIPYWSVQVAQPQHRNAVNKTSLCCKCAQNRSTKTSPKEKVISKKLKCGRSDVQRWNNFWSDIFNSWGEGIKLKSRHVDEARRWRLVKLALLMRWTHCSHPAW